MRQAFPIGLCGALLSCIALDAGGQTTRPAAQDSARPTRVLVLPFESLSGDNAEHAVVARALRRSVELDLARHRNYQTISSEKVAPDAAGALESGKTLEADFVVWGTTQVVDDRVRVSGEVLDVARGELVGQFKVTGALRELFELQDAVAEQVRRRLTRRDQRPRATTRDDGDERVEIPPFDPLRVDRRRFESDWLAPAGALHDDITYRYNFGHVPYGFTPFAYGCSPYFGYYRYSYSPHRLVYRDRSADYTYRGLPDRRGYYGYHYGHGLRPLRSFDGPVPLRWLRRH